MQSAACCISLHINSLIVKIHQNQPLGSFLVAAPAFLNPRFSTCCFFSEYNLNNERITLTVLSLLSFPFIGSVRFTVFHALGIMALTNCRYCGHKKFQLGPVSYPLPAAYCPTGICSALCPFSTESIVLYTYWNEISVLFGLCGYAFWQLGSHQLSQSLEEEK